MSEYNRHKFAMEWMYGGGRDPNGRSLDEEIQIADDMWKERVSMAEGGTPQLVQPGPGRQGYADKRKSPTKINEDLFTKIDDLIADAGKAGKVLDKKALGEGLGYKVVEKGKTAGQGGLNKVIEAWEESRDTVFEYKPSKLTLDSPQVKEVLKLQEEGMSTRQITKKLGYKDEKAVRNIFKQFRPDAIKEPNVPGEITSAKQSKIKATKNIKIAEKKAGPTTTKQAKDVKSQILEYNNPYKKISAVELAKDKEFLKRLRVHIDINTGAVTYDGYTKANPRKGKVFNDLELAEHAIKKANQGQLFTDDHITPKSLQKQNVGYPRNLQPVTYIENSEFDNARKYVLNKPDGNTSAIHKYLTKNNQTLRFPDQKIKLGVQEVIEYNPKTGSQTLVKKDFLKLAPPKSTTKTIPAATTKGRIDEALKGDKFKGMRNFLKGEGWFAAADFLNNLSKGQSVTKAFNKASEAALWGMKDLDADEKALIKHATEQGASEEEIGALRNYLNYMKKYKAYERANKMLEYTKKNLNAGAGTDDYMDISTTWDDVTDAAQNFKLRGDELENLYNIYAEGTQDMELGKNMLTKYIDSLAAEEWNKTAGTRWDRGARPNQGEGIIWGGVGSILRDVGAIATGKMPTNFWDWAVPAQIDPWSKDEKQIRLMERPAVGTNYPEYDLAREDMNLDLGYALQAEGGIVGLLKK